MVGLEKCLNTTNTELLSLNNFDFYTSKHSNDLNYGQIQDSTISVDSDCNNDIDQFEEIVYYENGPNSFVFTARCFFCFCVI